MIICLNIVPGFTAANMEETYAIMRLFSVFVCSQKSAGHPPSSLTLYMIKTFYMPLKNKTESGHTCKKLQKGYFEGKEVHVMRAP